MHTGKPKSKLTSQQIITNNVSYSYNSIQKVRQGCYDNNKKLKIDQGYGDYNMSLFRLKEKRRYTKDLPSVFTPLMRQLMKQSIKKENEKFDRIATQHNDQIQKILAQPKETYINRMNRERQQRIQQERIKNQYIKGDDIQVRQFQQQLSFNYLPIYQAQKWFKIRDHVSMSLPPLVKIAQPQFRSPPQAKNKKKKGLIFISDYISKTSPNKTKF